MIREILVPLDTSSLAEAVLPHVEAIASAFDARVHLVSVLERDTADSETVDSVDWRLTCNQREAYLARVAASLRELGLKVGWETAFGTAAEQILEIASARGVDMMILTSHGHGGLSDFRLSGTVSKVISGANVSILVLRPTQAGTVAAPLIYRRILAPVDCSTRGDWSVHLAAQLAQAHRAELVLVTVVEPPNLLGGPHRWSDQRQLARRLGALNRAVAQEHVDELAARIASDRLRVRTRIVEELHAGQALQEIAREERCSLVVLSAHGQSSETGRAYGSVTRRLLEDCDLPVLVFQDFGAAHHDQTVDEAPRERLRFGT